MFQFKLIKQVPELAYTAQSSAQLSNSTWSEAMHNMSELKTTFHSLNCFCYMIYMPQISTHKNIAKLLTNS